VAEVRSGSPADGAGVRAGDVVLGINQTPVNNASDLVNAGRNLKNGDMVRLRLLRNGQILFIAFNLS
jgi:S1-C subfamily serine protease